MAWKLHDNRVINSPESFVDLNGTRRSKDIFTKWSKEELLAIDVRIFHATNYDRSFYRQTGFNDEVIDNEVYRTYTTEEKYTLQELKNVLKEKNYEQYSSILEQTDSLVVSYEANKKTIPVSIQEERIAAEKMKDDNIVIIDELESYNPYVELEKIEDIVVDQNLKNEYLTISTKLAIRRAIRALGYEAELNVLLTNPAFQVEWNDATSIDFTEPLVIQALSSLTPTLDEIKTKIWELMAAEV